MSEPKIDEMLAYFKRGEYRELAQVDATKLIRHIELEAIRAFVERVRQRVIRQDGEVEHWNYAMLDELSAMELGPEELARMRGETND